MDFVKKAFPPFIFGARSEIEGQIDRDPEGLTMQLQRMEVCIVISEIMVTKGSSSG
jgi:hypothetical protein